MEKYVGLSRVMGFTMLVAVVDVILITAIATLGAFLYNMAAALLGGVEVTLAEDKPDSAVRRPVSRRPPAFCRAVPRWGNVLPRSPSAALDPLFVGRPRAYSSDG